MSWNWCSSTVFHDALELVVRVGGAGADGARSSPTARPRAAGARCGGCPASCGPAWCRCRGGTPGTARPTQTGGVGVLRLRRPGRTRRGCRARPAASLRGPRCGAAAASISRVGPPPPSPQPKGTSEVLARALLGEVALGAGELVAGEVGVVGVDRREVREDAGAVDALPPERVVREAVRLVPGDLLGEEPAASPPPRRSAAGPRCSRRSRAARPRAARRRTPRGRTACRRRTAGPAPRRRACWCRTPPTCRRPARSGPRPTRSRMRSNSSG